MEENNCPCGKEHIPNDETIAALEAVEAGDVIKYDSFEEMMEALKL